MMDGIVRAAGGVVAVPDGDLGGDGTQCSDHPYMNSTSGGGICAFCLQEKLGKLVSSSSSSFFIGGSSSSSPSFRSDPSAAAVVGGFGRGGTASNAVSLSLSLARRPAASAGAVVSSSSTNGLHHEDHGYCSTSKIPRKTRIPFLLTHKKKKATAEHHHSNLVLKRSKSTVTPRRRGGNAYLSSDDGEDYYNTHQKRGFWSFLYSSKPKSDQKPRPSSTRDLKPESSEPVPAASTSVTTAESAAARSLPSLSSNKHKNGAPVAPGASSSTSTSGSKRTEYVVVVDENEDSPNSSSSKATSFGRKVSRSRSVGCGSRSFSGDFFERISTGFGDCTLRRVESQREGKRSSTSSVRGAAGDVIKERVRCGGIFSGFMTTSSSSSSSSSSYRLSSSTTNEDANGKASASLGTRLVATPAAGPLVHGRSRSRSLGWAFASPMRVFGKSSSSSAKDGKTTASKSNPTPNLAAIPSLLTARG